MENLLAIMIGAIFVNNFILTRFLGLCPFFGVSRKTSSAIGMGVAVTFVMTLASVVTWAIYNLILVPLNIGYLQIVTFILVIATLVQLVELFLKKRSYPLWELGYSEQPDYITVSNFLMNLQK